MAREAGAEPCLGAGESAAAAGILVVEDDPGIAKLLRMLLERRGWRVWTARDGAEARRVFASHETQIALAMLDCRLPDTTGGELGRALRSRVADLPVVFMSGRNQLPLAEAMGTQGPTGFLPKPFFPGDVDRVVHALAPAIA